MFLNKIYLHEKNFKLKRWYRFYTVKTGIRSDFTTVSNINLYYVGNCFSRLFNARESSSCCFNFRYSRSVYQKNLDR